MCDCSYLIIARELWAHRQPLLGILSFLLFFSIAAPASAQGGAAPDTNVRIVEIGLRGIHGGGNSPSRVLLDVKNPAAAAQTLILELELWNLESESVQVQRTLKRMWEASEAQRIEVPFPIPSSRGGRARRTILSVLLRDAGGRLIGQSYRVIRSEPGEEQRQMVVLMCESQEVCQKIQSAILFTGTVVQQAEKSQGLRFVQLKNPGENWWAYAPADVVLLARRASTLTRGQRAALEGHVYHGGKLVVAESELNGDPFFAAYRRGKAVGQHAVGSGSGELHVLPNLVASNWGNAFVEKHMLWSRQQEFRPEANLAAFVRWRLGTNLTFPGLWWMLGWLVAYLIAAGPVNFFLLHRLRRREIGWLTVPAISLLFALALYVLSAAKRPAGFSVDEVAVDWMDDRSPRAAREAVLRVASPWRAEVPLSIAREALLLDRADDEPYAYVSGGGYGRPDSSFAREAELGTPQRFQFPLTTWSFRDFRLADAPSLPGTIQRLDALRLRNATGRRFREAIYADRERVFFIGAVEPGGTIDLALCRKSPLAEHIGRGRGFPRPYQHQSASTKTPQQEYQEQRELETLLAAPFSIVELIRGWPADAAYLMKGRRAVFYGLSEEAALGAEIEGQGFARKQFVVTVVSFLKDQPASGKGSGEDDDTVAHAAEPSGVLPGAARRVGRE